MSDTPAKLAAFSHRHPIARLILTPGIRLRRQWQAISNRKSLALFERFASQLAEDPCVKVPEFDGEFYLDSRSAIFRRLMTEGVYEPALSRLCVGLRDPDRDVLDIGANVGFHSVLFGRQAGSGRVLAVEPTRHALARLRRNLDRNAVSDKVTIFEGVVSDSAGEIAIKTIPGREEFSSIGEMVHPSVAGEPYLTETVRAVTADELVRMHGLDPGFVKVDVEGVEHRVFAGAGELLERYRPVIVSELSEPILRRNGSSSAEVIAMIERHGYEVTDPIYPALKAGTRPFADILCRPRP